jgi:hypothetical protein
MCIWQEVQKLPVQRPVDQRVLCNTPREFVEKESAGVGYPGGSIVGNCNVERTGSVIYMNTHGLIRIAASEYIHGVIPEAGDPDITIGI